MASKPKIFAGLELVLSHTEKLYIALYWRQDDSENYGAY